MKLIRSAFLARQAQYPYLWMGIAFLLWLFLFRDFLLERLSLVHDAISYYEHIKFYVDNLRKGIFPLWDPTWCGGASNSFFLRRIGAYNPFYGLIVLFNTLGLTYSTSYLLFLAVYYFIGMVGFYKLTFLLFKNKRLAFAGFLFLLFSSMAARLFDSYLNLVLVPMIWFFFFLIDFSRRPQRHSLLGFTLSLMTLMTTYIPFYFVTILLSFLFCYTLVYFSHLTNVLRNLAGFVIKHNICVLLCLLSLSLAMVPSVMFYQESRQGEFTLPHRAGNTQGENTIQVDIGKITEWGVTEEIYFSGLLSSLKEIQFRVVYIPFFAFILLGLGAFVKISRRLLFFFVWGCLVFLIGTSTSPVYQFLYHHVFFFKYFRNLDFFVWFILMPLFIFFVLELLNSLLKETPLPAKLILLLHLIVLSVVFLFKQSAVSTYLTIGLSLIFFTLLSNGFFKNKDWVVFPFLLLVITAQPMEAYYHLSQNSPAFTGRTTYDRPYLSLAYTTPTSDTPVPEIDLKKNPPPSAAARLKKTSGIYYGTTWYDLALRQFDESLYQRYRRHKFILYDRVEEIDDQNIPVERMEEAWASGQNIAFVSRAGINTHGAANASPYAQPVEKDSESFRVLSYDMNAVRIRANFPTDKFLVYNDNFHSGWQAFINGEKKDILRANIASKGVWLPPGENVVVFRFGTQMDYIINYSLLAVFYTLLAGLLILWVKPAHVTTGPKPDESLAV